MNLNTFQKDAAHSSSRNFLSGLFISFAAVIGLAGLSHSFDLTVTQTPGTGKTYTLSWTAVDKSTTDANITYCAYTEFGSASDSVDLIAANRIRCVIDELQMTVSQTDLPTQVSIGSRGFIMQSTDSADATRIFQSNQVTHGFIHLDAGTNLGASIERTDGDGTQRGVDQIWKFTYKMDTDALITMRVFPPGSLFTADGNGFVTGSSNNAAIRTILDGVPRPGELGSGSVFASNGDDTWDSRSSSGIVVGNGIYYVLIQARLDPGQTGYNEGGAGAGELRFGSVFTIPVDILRIANFSATGITPSAPTATISYDITGDALVRVVIAEPGSRFTIDSDGDVQPIDSNGAIDSSLIVNSFNFQRKAGANTEQWDGTSSTGAIKASGVYPISISAKDEYGNHAIDLTGNDFAQFTTITLERSADSETGTGTDTTAPTLTSISPADGTVTAAAVSTVTVVYQDEASALVLASSAFEIRDPNGIRIADTLYTATESNGNTIDYVFNPPLETNGTYNLTLSAVDSAGNTGNFTSKFSINIALSQSLFEKSLAVYPNPAKNSNVTVAFDLSVDATVNLSIYTLMGERVFQSSTSETAGTSRTVTWNTLSSGGQRVATGLYLVQLEAVGGGATVKTIKKLVLVR